MFWRQRLSLPKPTSFLAVLQETTVHKKRQLASAHQCRVIAWILSLSHGLRVRHYEFPHVVQDLQFIHIVLYCLTWFTTFCIFLRHLEEWPEGARSGLGYAPQNPDVVTAPWGLLRRAADCGSSAENVGGRSPCASLCPRGNRQKQVVNKADKMQINGRIMGGELGGEHYSICVQYAYCVT